MDTHTPSSSRNSFSECSTPSESDEGASFYTVVDDTEEIYSKDQYHVDEHKDVSTIKAVEISLEENLNLNQRNPSPSLSNEHRNPSPELPSFHSNLPQNRPLPRPRLPTYHSASTSYHRSNNTTLQTRSRQDLLALHAHSCALIACLENTDLSNNSPLHKKRQRVLRTESGGAYLSSSTSLPRSLNGKGRGSRLGSLNLMTMAGERGGRSRQGSYTSTAASSVMLQRSRQNSFGGSVISQKHRDQQLRSDFPPSRTYAETSESLPSSLLQSRSSTFQASADSIFPDSSTISQSSPAPWSREECIGVDSADAGLSRVWKKIVPRWLRRNEGREGTGNGKKRDGEGAVVRRKYRGGGGGSVRRYRMDQ